MAKQLLNTLENSKSLLAPMDAVGYLCIWTRP